MSNIDLFKQFFKEFIDGEVNITEFNKIFNRELFVEEYLKNLSNEELEIIKKVKNIIEQKHKDKNIGNKKVREIVNEALQDIENLKSSSKQ